jgi:hypothetical protein
LVKLRQQQPILLQDGAKEQRQRLHHALHQEASEDAHVQARVAPGIPGIHEERGPMLIGLIGDPPLELAGMDLGAVGQVERHHSSDLVRLQLLGRLGALLAHVVASDERRGQKVLEDDEQKE